MFILGIIVGWILGAWRSPRAARRQMVVWTLVICWFIEQPPLYSTLFTFRIPFFLQPEIISEYLYPITTIIFNGHWVVIVVKFENGLTWLTYLDNQITLMFEGKEIFPAKIIKSDKSRSIIITLIYIRIKQVLRARKIWNLCELPKLDLQSVLPKGI